MSAHRTQVLFVPYRGAKDNKEKNGEISQQKHAAREYHRKAKLKRQALKSKDRSRDTIRSKSDASETKSVASASDSSLTLSSRSVSPTTISSTSPARREPSPVSVLGAGRVDPFDSQPVKDLTPCVHEMVDYGTLSTSSVTLADHYSPGLSMANFQIRQPFIHIPRYEDQARPSFTGITDFFLLHRVCCCYAFRPVQGRTGSSGYESHASIGL
jgi:hypothetical protein